jgi:hypothetical protein
MIEEDLYEEEHELEASTKVEWSEYPDAVAHYLRSAFRAFIKTYGDESPPAIVFELWADSGRLIVYDSPVGERLRDRQERFYTQLYSTALQQRSDDGTIPLEQHDPGDPSTEIIRDVWDAARQGVAAVLTEPEFSRLASVRMIAMPWSNYDEVIDLMTRTPIAVPR